MSKSWGKTGSIIDNAMDLFKCDKASAEKLILKIQDNIIKEFYRLENKKSINEPNKI